MAKVKVYKVTIYNPATDEKIVSRRMATAQGVKLMGGQIIENTEIEIDESQLEKDEQWTSRDFAL